MTLLSDDVEVVGSNPAKMEEIISAIHDHQLRTSKQGKDLPSVLLIFDDLIANKKFFPSNGKGAKLIEFILSLRHLNSSVIITAQQYKLIPKILRTNCTLIFLFKLNDADFADVLKETNFNKEQFKSSYEKATKDRGFMYINMNERKIFKNFNTDMNEDD